MMDAFRRTATELAGQLARGDISSEELTRLHLERIAAVDGPIRAFTTVLGDEALAAARRSDEERRRGEVRGPLHGMPVSVKESIGMAGQASTLGVPARRGVLEARDAVMVRMLREAGAVVLGRTNVAQLLLFHESRNSLFGQTANPWSSNHTPGGSSGGEAAALAAGMSPLGVGTDIGGSIRVPAHFAGVAGLKPSLDRWSNLGLCTAIAGQEAIRGQVGPMARTARDLALFMGAIDPRAMSALDPRVAPVPWSDPARVDVRALRVGYYVDDGLVPSSSAVARAVARAARALRSAGAVVVEMTPPDIEDAIYTYFAALSSDAGATAFAFLGATEPDPSIKSLKTIAALPDALRSAAARVARVAGQDRLAHLLGVMGEKSVATYWKLTASLRAYATTAMRAMEAAGVDVLLCPAHATPALPHGMSKDFALAGSPSMLWNLAQFPAGVVPVTRVRSGETRRELTRDRLEKRAAEVDAASCGLPVGVQVVGRPWTDERVLAAMIAIEDDLAGDPERPVTPVP